MIRSLSSILIFEVLLLALRARTIRGDSLHGDSPGQRFKARSQVSLQVKSPLDLVYSNKPCEVSTAVLQMCVG